jgi:hypothetical protein
MKTSASRQLQANEHAARQTAVSSSVLPPPPSNSPHCLPKCVHSSFQELTTKKIACFSAYEPTTLCQKTTSPQKEKSHARLLETCTPESRDHLRRLFSAAPPDRYADPSSNGYWQRWCWVAHDVGQHPLLIGLQRADQNLERSNLFFACALRNGEYHNGRRASASQITETLRWCAQCMVARGLADLRRATPGQHNLDRTFSSYYEKYKRVDPPPEPQQALPNSTVRWIAETFLIAPTKRLKIIGDLVVLAFLILLRVGEYTPSKDPRRTIPLRKKDVRLWLNHQLISHDAPLVELLAADAVTLCLENQKNGNKNAVLHHTSSGDSVFNVRTCTPNFGRRCPLRIFCLRARSNAVSLGSR